MPALLSNFSLTTRLLRPSIAVDVNLDGTAEDYTNNLDNYSILHSLEGAIAGIVGIQLDADFTVPNADLNWAKSGLTTLAKIQVSDDNYATNFESTQFLGSTSGSNSVPFRDIKIKATSLNSDFLDQKPIRKVFLAQDISAILTQILTDVGVAASSISLTATGTIIPVYAVSDNFPASRYVDDLAKAGLLVVGFDRDGIFRARSILKLNFGSSIPAADTTILLDTVLNFESRSIKSAFYCNSIKVIGSQFTNIIDSQFYYNTNITGQEIKPNSRLIFSLPLTDLTIITLAPFLNRNATGVQFWGYSGLGSYFSFYNTDDSSGVLNNASIQFAGSSIVPDGDGEALLMVFQNTSLVSSFFLKAIIMNGSAVQKINTISVFEKSNGAIKRDGKEILIEIESDGIFDDIQAELIRGVIKLNCSTYADIYKAEIRGLPQLAIGSVVSLRDQNNTAQLCGVVEIDENVSQDGYVATITAKKLNTNVNYFRLDINNLDDPNFPLF